MNNQIIEEGKKLIQNLEMHDSDTRDRETVVEQRFLDDLDHGRETVIDNVGITNSMDFFYKELRPAEELMRGIHFCDLRRAKQALERKTEDLNGVAIFGKVIDSECNIEVKKQLINQLLEHGVQDGEITTLLSLAVLQGDNSLISFCFTKVNDFTKEDLTLLYALQRKDCETTMHLLKAGVRVSDDLIDIASTIDDIIPRACSDIQKLQNIEDNLSIRTHGIQESILRLEHSILLGHHLCSEVPDINSASL